MEPITDQSALTYLDFGISTASYSGCETIAIYNALLKTGKTTSLSDVMMRAQLSKSTMKAGEFGTDPYKLGDILTSYGVGYETIDSQAGLSSYSQAGDLMIVSMWN